MALFTIENLTFSYPEQTVRAIDDLTLTVPEGAFVVLCGPSGCGKSTLLRQLKPALAPHGVRSGRILFRDTPLEDVDARTQAARIGFVQQDVYLFSGSVFENIQYGKPGASKEEVIAASKMAGAHEFIEGLSNGYDTYVGERGVKLSGGQKQRISLARALLKDPAILVLDDTTSAVDMETESYIQEQLKKLGRKHTVFVIAYRISSIKDADVIFVMDEGRIVERGNHESLLKQNGYYATVYKHQNGMEG